MQPHDLQLALSSSIKLTWIGLFFNICLPGATGGDVVKIYYATENNRGRRLEIVTILMLDRVMGMFALLLLPLLLVPFWGHHLAAMQIVRALLWFAGVCVLGLCLGMLYCTGKHAARSRVLAWVYRTLPGGRYVARIFDTLQAYRSYKILFLKYYQYLSASMRA